MDDNFISVLILTHGILAQNYADIGSLLSTAFLVISSKKKIPVSPKQNGDSNRY